MDDKRDMVVKLEPGTSLRALAEANRTIDKLLELIEQRNQDIKFLSGRAASAGFVHFGEARETGAASNCIVAIAYGALPLEEQIFPNDLSDLAACCRMLEKLPKHRLTSTVHEAMFRATQYIAVKRRLNCEGGRG